MPVFPLSSLARLNSSANPGRRKSARRERCDDADCGGLEASVPNPKFASFRGVLVRELRIPRDTSNLLDLVWLWFRSPRDGPAGSKKADF